MNFCYYVFNILKTLGRLKYICVYPKTLPITNCELCNPLDNPKSIVSWNIQGLFLFMNPLKTENILRELHYFTEDIICLQEVFENPLKERIIEGLKDKYPYYLTGNRNKRFWVGEDCGLLVLSKYKVQFVKEVILDEYVFPDTMANKSVLYFRIGCRNFVTTHLQSSNMNDAEDIAIRQIKIVMNESPFKEYIITGDLNHPEAHLHIGCPKSIHKNTCNNEILDYIVPINLPNLAMDIGVSDIDITEVSDHYPLIGRIQ